MTIYIDIDGTICKTKGEDYVNAEPIPRRIKKYNKLYAKGHHIVYWTARGVGSGIDYTDITLSQLTKWGAKFHELKCGRDGGKPIYDLLIDDRARPK